MKTRIMSALIMLPLFILVFIGGKLLLAGCFVIAVLGAREFYRGFEAMGVHPSRIATDISILGLYAVGLFAGEEYSFYMLWVIVSVVMCLLCLFRFDRHEPVDALPTMAGIFYVVFFSYHVTLTDQSGEYGILVWLVFLSAFGTDVFAYFTGCLIGKHKLAPKISPKKTIEGSIGGFLGSILLCGLFGYFFAPFIFVHCLIIGGAGGIVSQFGDLSASAFKRKMGIKDYGNLIPGHGGILDRFDSVLFTAPMVYYYIMLVLG